MNTADRCPCGSNLMLEHCCGRLHAGEAAPSAEALMRSRYAAFVQRNEHYLLASWHLSTRPASVTFDDHRKWLGLKIVKVEAIKVEVSGADAALVEFIARYRIGGASAARHHERSRFIKQGNLWFYVDGVMIR